MKNYQIYSPLDVMLMSDFILILGGDNIRAYRECNTDQERINSMCFKILQERLINKNGISVFLNRLEPARIVAAVVWKRTNRANVDYIKFSTGVAVSATPENGFTPDPDVNALHHDFVNENDLLDLLNNISEGKIDNASVSDMQPYWDKYDESS